GAEGDEAAVGAEHEMPGLRARRHVDAVVLEAAAEERGDERALRQVVHLRGGDAVAPLPPADRRLGDRQPVAVDALERQRQVVRDVQRMRWTERPAPGALVAG